MPLGRLTDPIFNLAFDAGGRLWATTGGGPLLQLEPSTGEVLNRYGDGLTVGLAVDPDSGQLFVGSGGGVEIFDPDTETFSHFSRDLDLRVGSLAFDNDGTLWGVTWPDRHQVVKFTPTARAEKMLEFDSEIDSIAFGQAGTTLAGLLFISHNNSHGNEGGNLAVDPDSQLTMVDVATMQSTVIARGGTRGDVLITTSDGRVLLSQSNQVDVIAPAVAPIVTSTSPADQATIPLPLPLVAIRFDQDMFAGDPTSATSVINPANYRLAGDAVGQIPVRSVVYDAQARTTLVFFDQLPPDNYTLTVDSNVSSFLGLSLVGEHHVQFTLAADLQPLVGFDFTNARSDRASGTVSYDVTVTNTGDNAIVLPVLLTLDPALGYPGVPAGASGQTEDGQWLVDLSQGLAQTVRLEPGDQIVGRTITIINPNDRRVRFTHGLAGETLPNQAPIFTTTPLITASVDAPYTYDADAIDPDDHPIEFVLMQAPDGMSVDRDTGAITWLPTATSAASTSVVLLAADRLGAVTAQRFVINVLGGNRPPVVHNAQPQIELTEGQPFELQLLVSDPDADRFAVWVDNLPPGALFDPSLQTLTWTPEFDAAGTYGDVRFIASDGLLETIISTTLVVHQGRRPLTVLRPADRTIREGDSFNFYVQATSDDPDNVRFSSNRLPVGATLHPISGLFRWTPGFAQAGSFEIPLTVTDGIETRTVTTKIKVTNANAAPQFVPQDGWTVVEGQELAFYAFAFDPDNPYYFPPALDATGGLIDIEALSPPSVTIEVSGLPNGASFDPDTTLLRWTPSFDQSGSYEVTFTATDDGDGTSNVMTDTITVPIEVLNINGGPVLSDLANVTVTKDTVVDIPISATDPEGDPIIFTAELESPGFPLPDFMTLINNGDGTGLLRVAPTTGHRGSWPIILHATDDGNGGISDPLSDSFLFVVTVESANEPPTWRFVGDTVAVVGQPLQLEVRADDIDQESLSFAVAGLPTAAVLSPGAVYGTALLDWTPTTQDIGTYDASFTVTDSGGRGAALLSDTTTIQLRVKQSNHPPQLSPVGNRTLAEGDLLTVQLAASDPNNDPVHFNVSGLPGGATFDPATGLLQWQTDFEDEGTYQVTLTATDGNLSGSETISIDVSHTNQSPIFPPLDDLIAREGNELRFAVSANDGDNDSLLYDLIAAPLGAQINRSNGLFFWTPRYDQAGEHVITFAVQDTSGATDTLDVNVDVINVNRLPVINVSDHAVLIGQPLVFKVDAFDADAGTTITYSAIDLPAGATLDELTGQFSWTPGPGQGGDHFVTFRASDQQATVSRVVVLTADIEASPPSVLIELTPSFPVLPNQPLLVHAIADSRADITNLSLTLNGQSVTLDTNGRATISWPTIGKVPLVATAIDADGLVGTATQ